MHCEILKSLIRIINSNSGHSKIQLSKLSIPLFAVIKPFKQDKRKFRYHWRVEIELFVTTAAKPKIQFPAHYWYTWPAGLKSLK